jgi:hypothetical protein
METMKDTNWGARALIARAAIPGWLRTLSKPFGGRRAGTYALPILVAVASLGFEHAEAGILHAPPVSSGLSRPTLAELGLRETGLERTATIRDYARRYGIRWQLAEAIHDAAAHAGIDVGLAYRLVRVESSFKQGAIGPAGSIGFTQVQPNTARWLDPEVTREDLFDVETNLRLGFGYLRMLIDRYRDTRLALLAYNRGPETIRAVLDAGEDPANGYASRVLGGLTR